jgi:hypothetical protein
VSGIYEVMSYLVTKVEADRDSDSARVVAVGCAGAGDEAERMAGGDRGSGGSWAVGSGDRVAAADCVERGTAHRKVES